MKLLGRLLPGSAIAFATFVCALPWGAAGPFRLVLPLLPYVVIHRCAERWPGATPDWLVFAAGFAMDVVGQGPLGYWSFIYLCGYTLVRSSAVDADPGHVSAISSFLLAICSMALMQWSLTSVYYLRTAEFIPHAVAAVIATLAYLLLLLLAPARSSDETRLNTRLERGV